MIPWLVARALAEPVDGVVDLHAHLASHLAVRAYRPGPDAPLPENADWRGRTQRRYDEPAVRASGVVLFVSAAYAHPATMYLHSRARTEKVVEAQLAYVEGFVAAHPDVYALARTPEEARAAIADGRIVFVHAIEGATNLIRTPEQVRRWADRGVAVITPIHLADNQLGTATHTWSFGWLTNFRGKVRSLVSDRGLRPRGEAVVGAMIDAGIVVDLTHMSPASVSDALDLLDAHRAPVLVTHTGVAGVRHRPHETSDAQLDRIVDRGGLVGLAGNATEMGPVPRRALPDDHCPESVDDFRLHYAYLDGYLPDGVAIGWGSDFQGGVHEYRPRRGPDGCFDRDAELTGYPRVGLAHVGYADAFFAELGERGADLTRLKGSAEAFLRIWEEARALRR